MATIETASLGDVSQLVELLSALFAQEHEF